MVILNIVQVHVEKFVATYAVDVHKFDCCLFFGLIQSLEFNVTRWQCIIRERTLQRIQVMRSYGNQRAPPANEQNLRSDSHSLLTRSTLMQVC